MTIDRAIKREQAKAEEYRAMSSEGNAEIAEINIRCSKHHELLAEWLEELKFRRVLLLQCEKEFFAGYEKGKTEGYTKAIDDFAEKIMEYCSMSDMNKKMIRQIAEQLKEGGLNV